MASNPTKSSSEDETKFAIKWSEPTPTIDTSTLGSTSQELSESHKKITQLALLMRERSEFVFLESAKRLEVDADGDEFLTWYGQKGGASCVIMREEFDQMRDRLWKIESDISLAWDRMEIQEGG
ncbi:MAG: hypothetical protein Q9212_006046 [Teloschistes hypoglaucus]